MVVSLLFLFFFMPAAFERWPLTNEATGTAEAPAIDPAFFGGWDKVGDWIIGHNGMMTAGGLAVIAFCALGMSRMETLGAVDAALFAQGQGRDRLRMARRAPGQPDPDGSRASTSTR